MSHSPRQSNCTDDLQLTRLRDNKRRSRQRKRDYTASLETKLQELQSRGVQASQEVQLAARKVVAENARLRALLRHVHVNEKMIETWSPNDDVTSGSPFLPTEPTAVQKEHTLSCPGVRQSSCSRKELDKKGGCQDIDKTTNLVIPHCKVLTRLAQDPSTDVTQSMQEDDMIEEESGGVECSRAHAMLMQFATTEEKLDVVSEALEQGCVGKKGGGCKVLNEALWKAMDEIT
ncbi:hypothetical protein GLAREA_02713 [Glarea lozoyensis ATCC 20868]|uniref:BZIP domain-containing protein n=1 Tax=Glarea lozoyensis (strain ATCC 20868 / MF5171) TaxID=1116229 RepID=S3CNS1_GLAL2|nr:uncharacterized protein GLAREA_02713 [Glarea lozoyensis ATCC 20868]EPE26799.1 hypothetical protein GLAREA_02713 [Glarea lozoyensis ATCC 20868]